MPAGHGAGLRLDPSSAYIDGPMTESLQVQCCIAGGGPAGMMLGFLLGRAGVKTVVLEKHADFLRDFRGDTVHPSTLELMHELGLLEEFLKVPHDRIDHLTADDELHGRRGLRIERLGGQVRAEDVTAVIVGIASRSRISPACPCGATSSR